MEKGFAEARRTEQILVVDDEAGIRNLLRELLQKHGYRCRTAADAREARAILEAEPFELVISDVNMPRESGLSLVRHVFENCPDTAAVMVSVMDDPQVAREAFGLGIYGYVVKPFDLEGVLIVVENALRRRRLEIENRLHRETLEKLVAERTKQLQVSCERYRELVETLPGVVYTGATDWAIVFVDEKVRDLTGYSAREFLSGEVRWPDIILPEDLPGAKKAFRDALTGCLQFVREYRIRTRSGDVAWIQDRGKIVCREEGKVDHVSGFLFDITERKRTADAIVQAKEEWENTFDAVPDLIAILDADHRIVRMNRSMSKRLGVTLEEAVGRHCHELVHGLSEPILGCPHGRMLNSGEEYSAEIYDERLKGWFHVSCSPLHAPDGRMIGGVHVAREVTALKETARALRRAHAELSQLIEAISSVLITLDSKNRIVRWNSHAERVFGFTADQVRGKRLEDCDLRWQWGRVCDTLARCRDSRAPQRLEEVRFTRPNGKQGFLGMVFTPIPREGEEGSYVLIMAADITHRKIMESQLAQAQKLEAIGQLAAGIAHEINTPTQYVGDNTRFLKDAFDEILSIVRGYGALLERVKSEQPDHPDVRAIEELIQEVDLDYLMEEIPRAIEQSLDGVGRVAKIVLAMKEFSHPGVEEKVAVDINKAIENTVTVAHNEWKYVAELVTDFDRGMPNVPCLPGELNQVFLNIIVNAAQAIAEKTGDRPEAKGTITIRTRKNGGNCEIAVTDTGGGIPEEIQSRVFDPFFTTKEVGKGTGQGLAISHDVVVNKHGGTITFESEPGVGTTFLIQLPLDDSNAEKG